MYMDIIAMVMEVNNLIKTFQSMIFPKAKLLQL
jgi:hypothetical protein